MEIFTKYSIWFVVPILVLAAALSFYLYYKDKKLEKINKVALYLLAFLRFVTFSILGFLLLMPIIKHYNVIVDKPLIIIAQDKSASVGSTVSIDGCKPEEYKKNIQDLYQNLSEKYEVKLYTFGNQIGDSLNYKFDAKETNFAPIFRLIDKKYANYNIGALIISSDGIYNKGSNPAQLAKKFSFPIYTVALGDTSRKRDLVIKNVNANKIAFLNDIFPVELVFNSYQYAGKTANIKIINKGKVIDSQTINIDSEDFSKQVDFEIPANKKGLQSYTVVVDAKANEFSKKNNSKRFVVDIIDDKKKVLILYNSPHPDIAALKNALATNKNIKVESIAFEKFNINKSADYQIIIFHQLPSSRHDIRQFVDNATKKKIPLLYIFGKQTMLNRFNALNTGISIKSQKQMSEAALPEINPNFQLFEIDKEFKQLINECSPLNTFFGDYKVSKEFETLLTQNINGIGTEKPLMVFSNVLYSQSVKRGVLFGDGIWRWRIKDYLLNENHEQFDAFVNKIVQFLALDIKKERFMIYHKNIANENEELIIRAELYNQSYELYNKADVFFELKNEDDKVYKFTFSKSGLGYSLNIGKLPKGDYSFVASTFFEGRKYKKRGRISVVPLNIEDENFCANHFVLRQLNQQSGGKFYYPKQFAKLADDLKSNKSIKAISHSIVDLVDLVQVKWLLFVLIVLLSIEWFLRKFLGGSS